MVGRSVEIYFISTAALDKIMKHIVTNIWFAIIINLAYTTPHSNHTLILIFDIKFGKFYQRYN